MALSLARDGSFTKDTVPDTFVLSIPASERPAQTLLFPKDLCFPTLFPLGPSFQQNRPF
jgi:hypothetical protein